MEPESNNFRLNRKSALLTYPNVSLDIPFERFEEVLSSISPIKRIVTGKEIHPTTGIPHYHVYVEWINKINLVGNTGRNRLLVDGFGVHVSKHRRGLDGRKYCYQYVTKDGNFKESEGFDFYVCSKNFIKER